MKTNLDVAARGTSILWRMGELPLSKLLSFQKEDHFYSLSTRTYCWLSSSTVGVSCYALQLSFLGEKLGLCWEISCHQTALNPGNLTSFDVTWVRKTVGLSMKLTTSLKVCKATK